MLSDALSYLTSNTAITNVSPGSVARSLLEAMHWEYEHLYEYADSVLKQGAISTATGEYLERIGALFSYPRRNELVFNVSTNNYVSKAISDDMYRSEIINQCLRLEKANLNAIRFAALSVSGVIDLTIDEYAFGPGSIKMLVFVENGYTDTSVLAQVKTKVDAVKASGVWIDYVLPIKIPIGLTIHLLFDSKATNAEKQQLFYRVRQAIVLYFNELEAGKGLVAHELTQRIMDVSSLIYDFEIKSMTVNQISSLYANLFVEADEQLVLGALLLD